ncbi:MAG TPA: PDDEXK nuclease domain-containing protein [Fibrobacteraceae bacterium]|nr:PDDEXK nuclease domain-containing protein [Fibrobacteraceae bacterium]
MKFDLLCAKITDIHQNMASHAIQTVNQSLVIRNWLIGCMIVEYEQQGEDRAQYGIRLLPTLSRKLTRNGVTGCSRQDLDRCRNLYRIYPQLSMVLNGQKKICSTLSRKSKDKHLLLSPEMILQLSWSKLLELVKIEDPQVRYFYEVQCIQGNWSVRELQRQIGSLLYERVGLSRDKAGLLQEIQQKTEPKNLADLIRDPYVLEFTGLAEKPRYRESDLEQALLDHLQDFLLELGSGFCMEVRQKRITVGEEHDYIDLVFYHRILRCHLLIDLKVRPFEHGDVGQMNFYLNWWKDNAMGKEDQLPVGLILCTAKDAVKVSYATAGMDQKLFVSRYRLLLPKPEELQKLLEADQARMMQEHAGRKRK